MGSGAHGLILLASSNDDDDYKTEIDRKIASQPATEREDAEINGIEIIGTYTYGTVWVVVMT